MKTAADLRNIAIEYRNKSRVEEVVDNLTTFARRGSLNETIAIKPEEDDLVDQLKSLGFTILHDTTISPGIRMLTVGWMDSEIASYVKSVMNENRNRSEPQGS